MFGRWLQRQWFQRRLSPALWLLLPFFLPLHAVFVLVSNRRRRTARVVRLPVPVIVVGNLIVGGAGKTPLTLAVVRALGERGFRPGIVSRGYGRQGDALMAVDAMAEAKIVGDEPLLLARRAACPVWVGKKRVDAARALLVASPEVDVIVCDDGLQHYALGRDVALAVFDRRGTGNGWCLPLGPLRESLERLATVDAVIGNECDVSALAAGKPAFSMHLQAATFVRLGKAAQRCSAADLAGKTLHAVAGIGDPQRFFDTLAALGLHCVTHPFPDHHAYVAADLDFGPDAVLLMTEKDAVKCAGLVTGEAWCLPVEAIVPPALIDLIVEKVRGRPIA
ncbi:MAG: tetraacyldisaccharide 4'-kinase [Azonexus sp.]|nr:tetraacyldisaccharide 4'-kinase [Azonexus sp.]